MKQNPWICLYTPYEFHACLSLVLACTFKARSLDLRSKGRWCIPLYLNVYFSLWTTVCLLFKPSDLWSNGHCISYGIYVFLCCFFNRWILDPVAVMRSWDLDLDLWIHPTVQIVSCWANFFLLFVLYLFKYFLHFFWHFNAFKNSKNIVLIILIFSNFQKFILLVSFNFLLISSLDFNCCFIVSLYDDFNCYLLFSYVYS